MIEFYFDIQFVHLHYFYVIFLFISLVFLLEMFGYFLIVFMIFGELILFEVFILLILKVIINKVLPKVFDYALYFSYCFF